MHQPKNYTHSRDFAGPVPELRLDMPGQSSVGKQHGPPQANWTAVAAPFRAPFTRPEPLAASPQSGWQAGKLLRVAGTLARLSIPWLWKKASQPENR